jgi:hypothetical protein
MGEHAYKRDQRPLFFRVSILTYIILGISIVLFIVCILSIILPWGYTSSGGFELDWGFSSFAPYAILGTMLFNLMFLVVSRLIEKCMYIIVDFSIGIGFLFSQYYWQLSYKHAIVKPGFYLVYVGAALLILLGILCIVEMIAFPNLEAAGKARLVRYRFLERYR